MSAYVTTQEADTYFAQHLYAAAWTEATNKEAALATATRAIDRQLLRGRKADPGQDQLALPYATAPQVRKTRPGSGN